MLVLVELFIRLPDQLRRGSDRVVAADIADRNLYGVGGAGISASTRRFLLNLLYNAKCRLVIRAVTEQDEFISAVTGKEAAAPRQSPADAAQ